MADETGADDALLAELRTVIDMDDPPPPALVEAIKNSLDWLDADHQIAELVSDSHLAGAAALRAAHEPRVLTFTADESTLVVEVVEPPAAAPPDGRRVIGQIVPPAPAGVDVRTADGVTTHVRADEHGRFRATGVSPGPVTISVRYDDASRPPFVTTWIS
ncbi:carboxypeptidase regulatory-like domain-containing protein [Actinobacteria bacterium YIM 96077]|uniref:Carboxypeptidase regulatory-like domain-containing protein n=1 Tax=Phytoactinopolyspora halophila TaxID=1981511 RepID=A0A329QJK0_9ACTN|nr:carboxypeptidase regulatory-like domain-containing protein [Phytoactinopolyspora halophila]AYY13502.1 carboxypeptidase regulatory-like domain-containing protein [Actinobacteria bacterium YIM 96077]RAW12443.1 hypothetical protein DPM12_14870 [Phytoactinopolyspora halophila]